MQSEKRWNDDETYTWWYTCFLCVMALKGLEEAAARAYIAEHAGNADRKRSRVEAFAKAKQETREYYAVLGIEVAGKKLYRLSRDTFQEMFESLSDMLVLKTRAVQVLADDMKEHKVFTEQLRVATDPAEIRRLVDAIDALATKPDLVAYQTDRTEGQQWEMLLASAYSDEICTMPGGGYFRYFFICLGGGTGWRCLRMVPSKMWRKLFPEAAWVPRQRWYCSCATKYRAKFGVVCEAHRPKVGLFYMRAPCPDEDIIDLRAMRLERDNPHLTTPQALYDSLPVIHPSRTSLVEEVEDGIFKVKSEADFDAMPHFEWQQVFTFVKTLP